MFVKDFSFVEKYRVPGKRLLANSQKVGVFSLPYVDNSRIEVIASQALGWQHVSATIVLNPVDDPRIPTYKEMQTVQNLFFYPNERVIQYHPRRQDYVNDNPFVLHMWVADGNIMPYPDIARTDFQIANSFILPTADNKYLKTTMYVNDTWQMVSAQLIDKWGQKQDEYPTWDEMCLVKDMYFNPNDAAIQFMTEFPNVDSHTLCIWRPLTLDLPRPDSRMVGMGRKFTKFRR